MHHIFLSFPTSWAINGTCVLAQFVLLALPRATTSHCAGQHDLRQPVTIHWYRGQLLQQDLVRCAVDALAQAGPAEVLARLLPQVVLQGLLEIRHEALVRVQRSNARVHLVVELP
eukprot:2981513-Pyramimonas_sp.AAC.1